MRILILKVNVIVLQQNRKSKYHLLSTLHRSFFLLFVVSLDNSFYLVEDSNSLINFTYHRAQNNAKANMTFLVPTFMQPTLSIKLILFLLL